jgi:hypothetical protein
MLFASAAETLLQLSSDKKHLGGLPGITALLHTWTRTLDFHPHVHCIVTGGGLDVNEPQWIASKHDFLFPVQVLSRLFRGKFLAALSQAYERGILECAGGCSELSNPHAFTSLKNELYGMEWVVYAKQPFGGPSHVFEYLGRYTHRVAISNYRLISMADAGITFATKNGKTATLKPLEFIRRFLMHILPRKFVKIRHYGLKAACNVNTKLERARKLIESEMSFDVNQDASKVLSDDSLDSWIHHMMALTGVNLSVCPNCGTGKIIRTIIRPEKYREIEVEVIDSS